MGSDMEAPHNDIEAARLSLSDSSSRLARAERVFRSAELMKNTGVGRFFSAASAKTRLDRAFAALAAAVAGFQHSYHEMRECCSSQGIDFREYVSNYQLLDATLLGQEDYLAVDSEGTLWRLLERSGTLRSE